VFRTIGDQVSLWESLLPEEVLRLPEELARVDALLDDPAFFAPFAPHFHPLTGRPSTPMECYLRLMFLKFRYGLGFESVCAEVSDSITWRRFCRIPLEPQRTRKTVTLRRRGRGRRSRRRRRAAAWGLAPKVGCSYHPACLLEVSRTGAPPASGRRRLAGRRSLPEVAILQLCCRMAT
jgi:Transposase domain (DUF772)